MKKIGQILTLLKNFRRVRNSLSTLASLYAGDGVCAALGGLTDEELDAVVEAVKESGVRKVVEIGTLFGFTAREIARRCPEVKVIAVDNFSWNPFGLPASAHERFTRGVLAEYLANGRIELVNRDAEEFLASLANAAETFVFLDGDHRREAVARELELCLAVGVGHLAGHDFGNELFGVTAAVREKIGEPQIVKGMVWAK